MIFEHFAINVPDTRAVADWYIEHMNLKPLRRMKTEPYTTFLADSDGRVVVELYSNPTQPFPDYNARHPLVFHWAFVSADPEKDSKRLIEAGASFEEKVEPAPGTELIMLRDPFGIPLQLCKRSEPMI